MFYQISGNSFVIEWRDIELNDQTESKKIKIIL